MSYIMQPAHLNSMELLVWETRERLDNREIQITHDWALNCWISGQVEDEVMDFIKAKGYGRER